VDRTLSGAARVAVLAFCLMVCTAHAADRPWSVGVVIGVAATEDFDDWRSTGIPSHRVRSTSQHYLAGGMVEVRLTRRLSLEGNGLYRPLHFADSEVLADGSEGSGSPATVVTWQFPILAKYRLQSRERGVFVALGPSFRSAGNLNSTSPSKLGVTGGGGVEFHLHRVTIAPALRYTRWSASHAVTWRRERQNQFELVAGISF
jgi:hypothetical protein